METFDRLAFRSALLRRFPLALDVTITRVQSASILVDAQLVMGNAEETANLQQALESTASSALSDALGVTIEAVSQPTVTSQYVSVAPTSISPPPPTMPAEASDAHSLTVAAAPPPLDGTLVGVLGIGAFVAVLLIAILCVIVCVARCHRRNRSVERYLQHPADPRSNEADARRPPTKGASLASREFRPNAVVSTGSTPKMSMQI